MYYHSQLPRYRQRQMYYDAQLPHPQYRPLRLPAARREPVDGMTEAQHRAAMAAMSVIAAVGIGIVVFNFAAAFDDTPEPRLFVRLVGVEGLGIDDLWDWDSPVFELAVDVDMIPEESFYKGAPLHVGGGNDVLRVSHRGVVLAWGAVPHFTIHCKLQGRGAAGVATVVATAEGSVVREEMRNLIRAEQQALGRAEFDVDGDIQRLGGRLHCKFYLFQDEPTEWLPPCWVEKRRN